MRGGVALAFFRQRHADLAAFKDDDGIVEVQAAGDGRKQGHFHRRRIFAQVGVEGVGAVAVPGVEEVDMLLGEFQEGHAAVDEVLAGIGMNVLAEVDAPLRKVRIAFEKGDDLLAGGVAAVVDEDIRGRALSQDIRQKGPIRLIADMHMDALVGPVETATAFVDVEAVNFGLRAEVLFPEGEGTAFGNAHLDDFDGPVAESLEMPVISREIVVPFVQIAARVFQEKAVTVRQLARQKGTARHELVQPFMGMLLLQGGNIVKDALGQRLLDVRGGGIVLAHAVIRWGLGRFSARA